VLKRDYGVGLIRKGSPESRLSYSAAQIEAFNYADLVADRDRLLNLKPPGISANFCIRNRPNILRTNAFERPKHFL
jgi:hypothetical protein